MDKGRKRTMQVVLVLVYLCLTILGMILIKKGGNAGSLAVENGNINLGMNLVSLIGFIAYIGSFLLFTQIIVKFDLSYIVPLTTGIVQVITLIASKVIFHENITVYGIVGASIIIIGIIVMNWRPVSS